MKRYFGYGAGALVIVICAGIPIAYFLTRWLLLSVSFMATEQADQTFLDSAMGNWFATTAGLIGGIPIALWINRRQAESEQNIVNNARNSRREHVFKMLAVELIFNRGVISDLLTMQSENNAIAYTTGLKDDLWRALSNDNELQLTADFNALIAISDAYYHIRALMTLESHYYSLAFHEGIKGGSTHAWAQGIVDKVNAIRPGAIQSIDKAVEVIYEARREYYG